jgi:6-pyruvoyltetrahydropterin/6-carboxytetrahydropterin synthase
MFRLNREVRFGIPFSEERTPTPGTNGHGGIPPLKGAGFFYVLRVTLEGSLMPDTGYLLNIKDIDAIVRRDAVPLTEAWLRRNRFFAGGSLLIAMFDLLKPAWPTATLARLRLSLSPYLSLSIAASEYPMVRLSQKFEFCAAHRLYNSALSDAANQAAFGKCTNPLGHGHNYELQVTLRGKPDANGCLLPVPKLEQIVAETVIDRFDHKHLNAEVPEFKDLNPTVENIAMVAYRLLKPKFTAAGADLASVTVWETPKTWCDYME